MCSISLAFDWVWFADIVVYPQESNGDVKLLLSDAREFLQQFYQPINNNPAHAYISALPFTATTSIISLTSRDSYPRVLRVGDDIVGPSPPVLTAAVSGNIVAAIIGNCCLKVFDISRGDIECLCVMLDSLPPSINPEVGYSIALSHDTGMAAVARIGLKVYCLNGLKLVSKMEAINSESPITCLSFSLDDKRLVAGFMDGTLREVLVDCNTEIRQIKAIANMDEGSIVSVIYLDDGYRFASASFPSFPFKASGTVRIWDSSGNCTSNHLFEGKVLLLPMGSSRCAAFWEYNPHTKPGEALPMHFRIHDIVTAKLLFRCGPQTGYGSAHVKSTLDQYFSNFNFITISSDRRLAACAQLSGAPTLTVWELHTNRCITLVGHSWGISMVSFIDCAGAGYQLLSSSRDGTIRLWDLNPWLIGEPLQYPMLSWKASAGFTGRIPSPEYSTRMYEGGGWIGNGDGEYLFWLPWNRPFRHPLNTLIIGQCTDLDLKNFVHGKEWVKCREPLDADIQDGQARRSFES
jgi:WD40 repeat protein